MSDGRSPELRPLGASGLHVTPVGVGTSPLASMSRLYGYEVPDDRAVATVQAVFLSSINFIDTSNGYGEDGAAERRIGRAIREAGGLPPGLVLATKVDPDPATGDFSGDRVRASFEESLERLGVDHIALLHLHDPERIGFDAGVAPGGPVDALVELRREGLVDHLGVAGGTLSVLRRYLETGVFEVLLSHNRYTLLDRSARRLFEDARARGVGVINAAPYGGGMLAKGPGTQAKYAYRERNGGMAAAAEAMQEACARHQVPLAAAALQFSIRCPVIESTLVGVSTPQRVGETLDLAAQPIPGELWEELEALAPTPDLWVDVDDG